MRLQNSRLAVALLCTGIVTVLLAATGCRRDDTSKPSASASAQHASEHAGQVSTGLFRVTVEQVQQWTDDGTPLVLIDSRSDGSWRAAATKASGAIRVPPHAVADRLESIPRDGTIVVYCT
jgi:hypothetical protein